MRIGLVKSTALSLVALTASFGARADDNEVFIGQTGVTNTIFVDQLGDSNKVGANTGNLTLNQDGRDNDIDISQTGTDNQLGTQAGAPFDGVSQIGNLNFLVVQQLNSAPSGSNFVRALYQLSPVGTSLVRANDLTITQSSITSGAGLGSGEGAHEIGGVLQENTLANGATNLATITQLGGAFGDGHLINSVTQRGVGNALSLTQVDLGNTIDIVQQIGSDNSATVLQTAGSANIVEVVAQTGDHNQATATLTGSNNYILNITQNNALVALEGAVLRASNMELRAGVKALLFAGANLPPLNARILGGKNERSSKDIQQGRTGTRDGKCGRAGPKFHQWTMAARTKCRHV